MYEYLEVAFRTLRNERDVLLQGSRTESYQTHNYCVTSCYGPDESPYMVLISIPEQAPAERPGFKLQGRSKPRRGQLA
jgi:hypothetical protein